MRPWRCYDVLLCGQRIMVSLPSWIPVQTLSESLPALWVCPILKIINTLGCKYIKLAKSNLRNENKILVLTLVLRLGLPENHREMISKCKVPITTVLIMNKNGSSSSFVINMEPGIQEPFKVILQLCMYVHFFSGERAQTFHLILTERFMTQGSFRTTDLVSDQIHVCWGGNSQYGSNKNVFLE